MSQSHIRIPPDGAGKRIITSTIVDIDYTNLTGDIELGDNVTGSSSGLLGKVVHLIPSSASAGAVYVILNHEVADQVVGGETLTFLGNTPTGTATAVGTGTPFHTSKTQLVGANNPFYGQEIDVKGAASVRFAEGSPAFDAFGKMMMSESGLVGVYEFSASPMDDSFTLQTANGGTSTHDPLRSLVDLSTTTANGSSVIRTTNKDHFYWPGNGNTVLQTVACNNTGTTGNTRRWGYFDTENGLFFELYDSELRVVMRSSTSGSVVDTVVAQDQWNHDRLDGTGLSSVLLNVDKITPYFIDFQWLGAGRVRFGILSPSGERVVCHQFENSSQNNYAYMRTANLPIRHENFNRTATGSVSSLRGTCLAVRCEGLTDYTFYRFGHVHPAVTVTGPMIPVLSAQSKPTYNGNRNVVNTYPETYSCDVAGGRVRLDFFWPVTLTAATFAVDDETTLDFDHAATLATEDATSWLYFSQFLDDGCHTIDLTPYFHNNEEGILANPDGSVTAFSIVATKISGTGSPVINGAFTYKELR